MEKQKRNPKSKRSDLSQPQIKSILMGAIILAILYASFNLVQDMAQDEHTCSQPIEIITVPFNQASATQTACTYTGLVHLVIEGTGQAGGSDYSDAFYLYAHEDGTPYETPILEHFDLEIDGERAIYRLNLVDSPPTYNPEHVYAVDYQLGDTPRVINFRISDSIVDDNTGEFRITVSNEAE